MDNMAWQTSLIPDMSIGNAIETFESQAWYQGDYQAKSP
jgi:hypothetical protein